MFSSELNARAQRLLVEQKARAEKEKQRLEKERLLAERQRKREQEREEEARRKRVEQLAAEERAREAEFEERERNKGVFLRVELQALPADESIAQAKGVKRNKDKLILPPSVGASLLNQDARKNGAMLFQVALPSAPSSSGPPEAAAAAAAVSSGPTTSSQPQQAASPASGSGRTHAGVLEFTAPEGTVLLPRKVVQSLYGALDAQPHGTVVVSYRRLDKGSYVRYQPMSHGFHEALGEGLREALEAELMGHSTLTEGDWVTVAQDDREWPLRVQELQPSDAVSVLDVDFAADVMPSLEAELLAPLGRGAATPAGATGPAGGGARGARGGGGGGMSRRGGGGGRRARAPRGGGGRRCGCHSRRGGGSAGAAGGGASAGAGLLIGLLRRHVCLLVAGRVAHHAALRGRFTRAGAV